MSREKLPVQLYTNFVEVIPTNSMTPEQAKQSLAVILERGLSWPAGTELANAIADTLGLDRNQVDSALWKWVREQAASVEPQEG